MAEFPALPLFTDAYLADTRHLTAAQHGAYLLLLMTAWRTADCALPDDDDLLARYACMDKRTWLRNKPVLMAFWHWGDDAKWRQRRLADERHYVAQVSSKKSAAGKASALKRKNRQSTPVQQQGNRPAAPTPTPTQGEGKPSPPPSPPRLKPRQVPLEDVTLERNAEWLAGHRAEGRYVGHDERFILDYFRNYCASSGKVYKDHLAAYRNAFEWKDCQPKESYHAHPSRHPARPDKPTWQSEGARLRAKYAAEADREEQADALRAAGEDLRLAEGVWEDPGRVRDAGGGVRLDPGRV